MTGTPITKLMVSLFDIDGKQSIDKDRAWMPVMSGEINESDPVFVGFYAGESPPVGEDIELDIRGDETFWVYKSDYTIQDLMNETVTPQDLMEEVEEEQPNVEIAGLCKYLRY